MTNEQPLQNEGTEVEETPLQGTTKVELERPGRIGEKDCLADLFSVGSIITVNVPDSDKWGMFRIINSAGTLLTMKQVNKEI